MKYAVVFIVSLILNILVITMLKYVGHWDAICYIIGVILVGFETMMYLVVLSE